MTSYKQVSLTPDAHHALRQMKYVMSAEIAEEVTLSQAVLIAFALMKQDVKNDSGGIARIAREIGIEPQ